MNEVVAISVLKIRKNIYRSHVKLIRIFLVISNVYMFFIPNKTTFNKYCLTPQSFEIHPGKQYLVNFMVLVGTVNATVYMTEPIFTGLRHGKLS